MWETFEGLGHAREAVGVYRAETRVEPNVAAILDDLKPETVPFGLVQPIVASGWANGCRRAEGADEHET